MKEIKENGGVSSCLDSHNFIMGYYPQVQTTDHTTSGDLRGCMFAIMKGLLVCQVAIFSREGLQFFVRLKHEIYQQISVENQISELNEDGQSQKGKQKQQNYRPV